MSGGERLNHGGDRTTATIASSGTISDAIDLRAYSTGGYILPASFTGTGMTFQVSADGTTYTAHSVASVTVAQGKAYAFPAEVMAFPWVKLVSGSSEAASRSIVIARKR